MGNLFDLIEPAAQAPVANDDWRPEPPPSLSGVHEIYLNFETTGLKWFAGDRPISASLWLPGGEKGWYLPWAHRGGGNLPEERMKEWFHHEVRGKHITNINTRFDVHFGREWGVDFEEQGNTVSDVAHYAALLDDHRFSMKLDALIPDYLKEQPMQRLDESRMQSYSAGAAAPRSIYNVQSVHRLKQVFWPMMDEQDLQKVRQLEDDVIYVVCEMEKNGTIINQELLAIWIKETLDKYHKCLMELFNLTGLKLNPKSSKDAAKLFHHLKIPIVEMTENDTPSFTDAVVKQVKHPTVVLFRHAKKLASIHSKLKKYRKVIGTDGVLRYALHQLRASKDESADAGETGTVVGRFTSTEIAPGIGTNIQQVMKPEKQFRSFGDEYFIRDLHIPAPGMLHLASDAEQIQYRIFAHEANNPKIIEAYRQNPLLSYHRKTHEMFKIHKPDLSYGRCKDLNFAYMFAAGPSKLALMLEFITPKIYLELRAQRANRYHPWLASTLEILNIYDKELPEGSKLLKEATALAESRGFIKSILGRRMRFLRSPEGKAMRGHKALNGRIIMSEADIVKVKAVELHRNRKYTGLTLRFQVHDEFDGDILDQEGAKRVGEILNTQSFPSLRVPILWGIKTGTSWGACAAEELKKLREEALQ